MELLTQLLALTIFGQELCTCLKFIHKQWFQVTIRQAAKLAAIPALFVLLMPNALKPVLMIIDTMALLVLNAILVVTRLVFDKTSAVICVLMFVVMFVLRFHMEAAQLVSQTPI